MAYNATFTADFSRWDRSLADAKANLKSFELVGKSVENQLTRMTRGFSGETIQKEAAIAVSAVKAVGGATALTEKEQQKVNATVTEAIAKYRALGQQAPAELLKLQKETAKAEKQTSFLTTTIGKVGAVMAASFTVGAVANLARQTLEFAGTMSDLAARTGIGTKALQEFKFAGGQVGVSLDSITSAVGKLQNNIGEGNKSAVGALRQLGLSLEQIKALKPEDQFRVVSDRLKDVKDQTEFVQIGMDLMGKGFMEVAPLIRGDLQKLTDDARRLGVVLNDETIQALDGMGDRLDALNAVGMASFARALVNLEQPLTVFLNALGNTGDALGTLQDLFTESVAGWISAGAAMYELKAAALEFSQSINPVLRATGALDEEIQKAKKSAEDLRLQFRLMTDDIRRDAVRTALALAKLEEIRVDTQIGGSTGLVSLTKQLDEARKALAKLEKQDRENIKAGLALGKSHKEIADAIGTTEDVVRLFENALRDSEKAQKDSAKETENQRKAIEDLHDTMARLAAAFDKIEEKAQLEAAKDTLQEFRQELALVDARIQRSIEVQEQLPFALMAMAEVMPGVLGLLGQYGQMLAGVSTQAKKTETLIGSLNDTLLDSLREIPDIIVQGILHGASAEQVAVAVGSKLGSAIGGSIGKSIGKSIGGKLAPVLGEALGEALGALIGPLLDAIIKTRAEKTVERVAYEFGVGISEELAKGIEDEAKRQFGGNRQAAKIFNLDAIIREGGGLNSSNYQQLFARFRDLFSMIETGAFSAAQGIEVLDENFATFADFVTKGGSLASRELIDIINLTERFGLKSAEVSRFVVEQTDAALGGLTTFLDNAAVKTQAAADGIGAALFGIFESQTANGVPAAEIIAQLDPLIEKLDEQLKKAGLSGGAAFESIKALAAVAGHEIAGPLITGVLGLEQALAGLHNSGVLTEEMFDGLTASVSDTYKEILATGVDGARALQLISPTLQTIWELQQDFGYSVDEATQALLDEAEAAGTVGDAHRTAQEQMLKLMERQTKAIEHLAKAWGYVTDEINDAADAIENMPVPDYPIGVPEDDMWGNYNPNYQNAIPMANGGSGRVTRPTLFLAGERGPEDYAFSGANRSFGSDSGTVIAPVVIIQQAGEPLDKAFGRALSKLPVLARRNENQWASKVAAELAKYGDR